MDQKETFRGFVVPRQRLTTQRGYCSLSSRDCNSECKHCLFNQQNPETIEPFVEWMETRKK
jgi:hypothetical protein